MSTPTSDQNRGHEHDETWSSPLWGRPDTVGGWWPDPATELPPAPAAPVAVASRAPRNRTLLGLAAMLVAALVGVGLVKALPAGDDQVALPSPTPSASAPATVPSPGSSQDPDDALPSLPAIPGLPGSDDQGSSSGQGTATTAHQDAVNAVAPALVNITTAVGYDGSEAAGTGVVLTSDGIVLTNHHVIAGSTAIKAAVAGTSKTYTATVIGYDASHDIAVIKLENASGLATAPIGDSGTVRVGDVVIGLGNAGGLGGKPIPADGTVTGLDRSITAMNSENGTSEDLSGLIETDADIRPGDSGGALVSADGKVIGIVTAGSVSGFHAQSGTDGYAVPINQAMQIAQDIRDGKASSTIHIGSSAFLGIQVASAQSSGSGVLISGTVSGTAAARAGLQAGDRITSIDGRKVTDGASIKAIMAQHHPGDSVSLTWTDTNGRSQSTTVTLGSGPVG